LRFLTRDGRASAGANRRMREEQAFVGQHLKV